jgi:hypothetical protein
MYREKEKAELVKWGKLSGDRRSVSLFAPVRPSANKNHLLAPKDKYFKDFDFSL